jgi:hypothetical protein
MPINETVTGDDSVAITGTATAGQRTIGINALDFVAGRSGAPSLCACSKTQKGNWHD